MPVGGGMRIITSSVVFVLTLFVLSACQHSSDGFVTSLPWLGSSNESDEEQEGDEAPPNTQNKDDEHEGIIELRPKGHKKETDTDVDVASLGSHEEEKGSSRDLHRKHDDRIGRFNKAARQNKTMHVQEIEVRPGQAPDESWDGKHPVVRVSYKDKVFFDFDRYVVRESGKQVLHELAQLLLKEPKGTKMLIVGHTDSKGADIYNQSLSEKRALAVVDYFSKQQFANISFEYSGVGETQPLASNEDENGRALNRRVEFFLSANARANSRALVETPFDPCNWNNHPGAFKKEGTVGCSTEANRDGVVIKAASRSNQPSPPTSLNYSRWTVN